MGLCRTALKLGMKLYADKERVDRFIKLDNRALHPKTNAEKRNLLLSHVLDCLDLAFDSTRAKSRRNENAIDPFKERIDILLSLEFLGVDPDQFNLRVILRAGMDERLR